MHFLWYFQTSKHDEGGEFLNFLPDIIYSVCLPQSCDIHNTPKYVLSTLFSCHKVMVSNPAESVIMGALAKSDIYHPAGSLYQQK